MLKEKSSALKFLENFEKGLKEINKEDLYVSYSDSKTWTPKIEKVYKYIEGNMFESSDSVTLYSKEQECNICQEYEKCQRTKKCNKGEYMNIDASYWIEDGYKSSVNVSKLGLEGNNNLWKPLIVVEHENDKKSNLYELKQLLFNNVKLRVLISYSDMIEKDLEGKTQEFLNSYQTIFEEFEKNLPMSKKDEFLILLGCTEHVFKSEKTIIYKSIIATKKDGEIVWSKPGEISIPAK